jgi:hypothetical protein
MYAHSWEIGDATVCYAMRTYLVKSRERLPENESGFRGYSSCQFGSGYHLRSANGQAEGAKSK